MGTSSGAYELNYEWDFYRDKTRDKHVVNKIYAGGKSSATMFYRINKTRFISFFVYRRQARDRLRLRIYFG